MDIAYGIQVKDRTDEFITIAESALEGLSEAAVPGAFLVDQIPWRTSPLPALSLSTLQISPIQCIVVKYIPSWFPGAGFQKKAQEWAHLANEMPNKPFNAVKAAVVRARPALL